MTLTKSISSSKHINGYIPLLMGVKKTNNKPGTGVIRHKRTMKVLDLFRFATKSQKS